MPVYLVLLLAQITLFSSTTALLLLLVKWLFRCRIPPKVSMVLWLVLLVRVVCPIFPESEFSIYNIIPAGREILFTLTYDYGEIDVEEPSVTAETENPYVLIPDGEEQNTGTESAAAIRNTVENAYPRRTWGKTEWCILLLSLYGTGVVLCTAVHLHIYRKALRRIRMTTSPSFDNHIEALYRETAARLRIHRKLPELVVGETNMLCGVFHPFIQYNRNAVKTDGEYEMLFAHELAHFKHFDNQILLFSTCMCCLFWYNPLLWCVRKMLREDLELLCDTAALTSCGIKATDYALFLCRNADYSGLQINAGTAMSRSGRRLKNRLLTISNQKKQRFLPRPLSFILCIAIVAVCLTNPIVSGENAYETYIQNFAAISGRDSRDFYLNDTVSVYDFLTELSETIRYAGGEGMAEQIGGGSLEKLKRQVLLSDTVDRSIADAIGRMKPSDTMDNEKCALLLTAIAGMLAGDNTVSDVPLLPEFISTDTMQTLTQYLTEKEAATLRTLYNQGVYGAEVSFEYMYTNAMMDLITNRIQNAWAKEKFKGYYQEIHFSPEQLDVISNRLNETIHYIGVGTDFYLCDPDITPTEERILQRILEAAMAGQREDVYYRKNTEDGCTYEEAENLYTKAGLLADWSVTQMYEEYAKLGMTTYTYKIMDESGMISAYDVQKCAEQLDDPTLITQFETYFIKYDSYTSTDETNGPITRSIQYYAVNPANEEICLTLLSSVYARCNAVAFPMLVKTGSLRVTDTLSSAARDAAQNAVAHGWMDMDENSSISMRDTISSGQVCRILCRFMATMTNVYR